MQTTDKTPAAGALRAALADGVERWKPKVEALARNIHGYKEISFEEVQSAAAISA